MTGEAEAGVATGAGALAALAKLARIALLYASESVEAAVCATDAGTTVV